METTALNPTQMHLLKTFAFNDSEEYGWAPASLLPDAPYDETIDMTLHDPAAPKTPEDVATTYFKLHPGQVKA